MTSSTAFLCRFAGSTDVLLGDEGVVSPVGPLIACSFLQSSDLPRKKKQAEALAQRLCDSKITAVYCSPMKRTVRTAEILAAPHKLEVKVGEREMGFDSPSQ